MKHEAYGRTDVGRARERNEDAILLDSALGLYVVCDGCGGHEAGDVASRLTCEIVRRQIRRGAELLSSYARRPTRGGRRKLLELVERAVDAASKKVHAVARSEAGRAGMGTTVVLAAVVGSRAVIAHAGDSRAYLYRDGHVHLLTDDHNMANQYRKMGLITRKQAQRSRAREIITRAIGFHAKTHADTLHFELAGGDTLLLCTDGLTRYVSDVELAAEMRKVPPAELPHRLIGMANHRGGRDNISVVAVQAEPGRAGGEEDLLHRLRTLQRVPLFRHLSFRELLEVTDVAQVGTFPAGKRIIAQGAPSDRVYVSTHGTVKVVRDGRKVAELPAGSLFGEMGLIDEEPRSADVITATEVRLLAIRRLDFFSLLRRERTLAVKVLWGLCRLLDARLRTTTEKLSDVTTKLGELKRAARPFV